MAITIEALAELKNFEYRAATKSLRIMNFDSEGVPYYSPISEITDIAVAEAATYSEGLLTPKISPKTGDLTGTFASESMTLADYDLYEVTTNDTYDSTLDMNLKRGLVYWLTDTWVVFTSENYLQLQVTASKDSMVFNGVISDDFDQNAISDKKNGTLYTVTKRVQEYKTSQYFLKGIIVWSETKNSFVQLLETAKSQEIIATDGQTEFVVTDFTLGRYLFYINGSDYTEKTTALLQTITYSKIPAGDVILIINLS